MVRSASFFIALFTALSLFGCGSKETEQVSDISAPAADVSLTEDGRDEKPDSALESSGNFSNEIISSSVELVVEPAVWSPPSGNPFKVSDVLIAEAEDVNRLTINVLGNGIEKELELTGEDAVKAADALLNSEVCDLNAGISKKRRGDSYLFTMECKDGNVLTLYDSAYVEIKGHDMPCVRFDELRIPVPGSAQWKTFEMDLTTGLRKDENSEDNAYLDYLGKNLYPADYCTVSMEEERIFVYLCGNINEYNNALRQSVLDGCKNIGDAQIITLSANLSNLQEYYPMIKEIDRKIKELGLEEKLLVRLKNDRMQIFGNADDDLSEFLSWLSTYNKRSSVVVRLN